MRAVLRTWTPILSIHLALIGSLGFTYPAQASVLLESAAADPQADRWDAGLELGAGILSGERGNDNATLYRLMLGVFLRYRCVYVQPALELHYLKIDYEDAILKTKLSSTEMFGGDPRDAQFRRELVLGGTVGGVLPPAVLGQRFQVGMFLDGRFTPWAHELTLDELWVGAVNTLPQGKQYLALQYRWWTTVLAGFVNARLRDGRYGTLSLAGGWLHLHLEVEVAVQNPPLHYRSTYAASGETIAEDQPVGIVRYGLPLGRRFGIEVVGSLAPDDDNWVYRSEGLLSVRF